MEGGHEVDFRKSVKLGAGNLLRSSELRKLIEANKIVGDLSSGLQLQKVIGTKVLMYSAPGGNPLFFQLQKHLPLFPTLYAVWGGFMLHLPIVETSDAAFESVQRGSDLFAPGILSVSSENIQKDDPVLLSVERNIVAVGKAVQTLKGLESGPAIRSFHCFGDAVWMLGSKNDPAPLPAAPLVVQEEKVEESAELEPLTLSTAEVDEALKVAFILTLRGLKKSDFPLLFSTFGAKMMAVSPVPINMKQSSFKKIGAFLQSMAQDERVIKISEPKAGVFEIVDVDRCAPLYRHHKADPSSEVTAQPELELPPVVEVLYSLPKRMKHLFADVVPETLMSKGEARNLLLQRVKDKQLLIADRPGMAQLDEDLQIALKAKDSEIKMTDLVALWMDSLDCHSKTFVGNVAVIKKGSLAAIVIKEERKANKDRTTVDGLARFGIDADALASDCSKRFASSSSLNEKGVLQVQGSRASEIAHLLKTEYRVPKEYVTVVQSAAKQKKKK